MQAKLPVFAMIDPNTDIGIIILEGGFGWWCESNDIVRYFDLVKKIIKLDLIKQSDKAFKILNK